jgi:hypothetical protein
MKIVGCDLHARYQQVAMLDQDTGELIERRLEHANGEARATYANLQGRVRVGVEATGYTRWFERLLTKLGHELWIGDAAQIRATMVRKQKRARPCPHTASAVRRAVPPDLAADDGRVRSAGNWCGIARSWCGCAMRSATNCTPSPRAKVSVERRSCSANKAASNSRKPTTFLAPRRPAARSRAISAEGVLFLPQQFSTLYSEQ